MQPIHGTTTTPVYSLDTEAKEAEDPLSNKQPEEISLSKYFPKGSIYFYAFPAGEESGFFNGVSPEVEELVAARPLLCAGPDVRVLTFASGADVNTWQLLEELGVKLVYPNQVIILPKEINIHVKGAERNQAVKNALRKMSYKREVIMAQPYTDEDLRSTFQINPEITSFINDKKNLPAYVPEEHLPKEYKHYTSAKDFAKSSNDNLPLPCVVKVSSSSSGDGVRICKTAEDLAQSRKDFEPLNGHVIVYQFIESIANCCVQFGIPFDTQKEIEIIGFNEQLIGKCGEFLGGMVPASQYKAGLEPVYKVLLEKILPRVRSMGWYGVGGIDVLLTANGEFYFIDPNFRMTATFAFVNQVKNGEIKKSLLGFTGTFRGTEEEFRTKIMPIAHFGTTEQLLNIACLTRQEGIYRFNATLVFGDTEDPKDIAQKLLNLGIQGSTLLCLTS